MDLMNAGGMEAWTTAVGMRYRGRRDMLELVFQVGDPRVVLASLPGPIGCAVGWRAAASRKDVP